MTKKVKAPPRDTKVIRVSLDVVAALARKQNGFETHDAVLRRLLQLPPKKRAA